MGKGPLIKKRAVIMLTKGMYDDYEVICLFRAKKTFFLGDAIKEFSATAPDEDDLDEFAYFLSKKRYARLIACTEISLRTE